ncbi:MAG: hypothetical protein RL189_2505 [Pseudomonadota bacterium]
MLPGFEGERENLIAIALWSQPRGGEETQAIFSSQTALGIARIGLLNESSVEAFVPIGFRRRAAPPFPCKLIHRELPTSAILDDGELLFEHRKFVIRCVGPWKKAYSPKAMTLLC